MTSISEIDTIRERLTYSQQLQPTRDEVDLLFAVLDAAKSEVEQCHAKSTCCCGDYVKGHGTGSGHSAVSMYDYALDNSLADNTRLRTAVKELVQGLEVVLPMLGSPHGYTIADVWAAQEKTRALIAEHGDTTRNLAGDRAPAHGAGS